MRATVTVREVALFLIQNALYNVFPVAFVLQDR